MNDFLYDVVAAGHICLDISPGFPNKQFDKVEDTLVPGKLVNLDGITISAGGPVANTGFALKKIGMRVKPMANVGDDLLGDVLCKVVREQCGEDISINDNIATSYSVVLSIHGIDRIILHDPAGNNEFKSTDIDYNEVKKAKLFHFGYPPLMKKVYQDNGRELVSIYKKAKKTGVTTSLDMSLPDTNSDSGKVDWDQILRNTLPYVDVFLPSIEEALYMLDMPEYQRVKQLASTDNFIEHVDFSKLPVLGKKILNTGTKVAVIKCGSKGIYVKTSSLESFKSMGNIKLNVVDWAEKEFFEETYYVGSFKSALAAGDTTIAGFLSAMISGMDVYTSARFACKTGALCCEAYDSIGGLMQFNDIVDHMKSEPKKNHLQNAPISFAYDNKKNTWLIHA